MREWQRLHPRVTMLISGVFFTVLYAVFQRYLSHESWPKALIGGVITGIFWTFVFGAWMGVRWRRER